MGSCSSSPRVNPLITDDPQTKHNQQENAKNQIRNKKVSFGEIDESQSSTDSFGMADHNEVNNDDLEGGIPPVPSFFNQNKPVLKGYCFLDHVGHGSNSDVFLVRDTYEDKEYVGKVYMKSFINKVITDSQIKPIDKINSEIEILNELEHPNVIELVDCIADDQTNSVTLIMPYADRGSLADYLNDPECEPLSEEDAKIIFFQFAKGLQYIHSKDIIHRDIKPDNILLFSNGLIVIIDFNSAYKLNSPDELLSSTEGASAYYSPEECSGNPFHGKQADVWSFGLVLYQMIFKNLPFNVNEGYCESPFISFLAMVNCIMDPKPFTYPEDIPISPELQDLLSHVLDKNWETRYTIDQVIEHPWFDGVEEFVGNVLGFNYDS